MVARYGGEEFVLMLRHAPGRAQQVLVRLQRSLSTASSTTTARTSSSPSRPA
jgi:GGDEF domain-containing protein